MKDFKEILFEKLHIDKNVKVININELEQYEKLINSTVEAIHLNPPIKFEIKTDKGTYETCNVTYCNKSRSRNAIAFYKFYNESVDMLFVISEKDLKKLFVDKKSITSITYLGWSTVKLY